MTEPTTPYSFSTVSPAYIYWRDQPDLPVAWEACDNPAHMAWLTYYQTREQEQDRLALIRQYRTFLLPNLEDITDVKLKTIAIDILAKIIVFLENPEREQAHANLQMENSTHDAKVSNRMTKLMDAGFNNNFFINQGVAYSILNLERSAIYDFRQQNTEGISQVILCLELPNSHLGRVDANGLSPPITCARIRAEISGFPNNVPVL